MRFCIHYIEIGDGKRLHKGAKPYNGKRYLYIKAQDQEAAQARLRNRYTDGAIKSITSVVEAQSGKVEHPAGYVPRT